MRLNKGKSLLYINAILLLLIGLAFPQSLTISAGGNNHAASNESGSGNNIPMLQLQLSADATENIVISSIVISPTSLGFRNDEITGPDLNIYHDVNNNGLLETEIDELITTANYTGASYNPPGNVTVSIPDWVVFASSTQNWLFVNNFSGGDNTDYIEIAVSNNSDVTAEGQTSTTAATIAGAPVTGGRKTVTTTASAGNLFLGTSSQNPIDRNINDGADDEVMTQLTLYASTLESIDISEVSFEMSGSGDESLDISVARLYEDVDNNGQLNSQMDIELGTAIVSFLDDDTLLFDGLSETISAGESATWIVVYDLSSSETSPGETYDVTLTNNSDIIATGASSALSSTVSGAPVAGGLATISATGTLFLTEGTNNPDATNISADESELVLLQFNLAAGETENVNISAITFTTSGTANENTDLDSVELYLDLNNNGLYDPYIDTQIGAAQTSFTDNGDITFSSLSETIIAEGSENWILVYYLNGSASSTETFQAYLDQNSDITATGAVSSNSISAAGLSIYGNYVTVSTVGALTINIGSSNPGDENINGGSSNVVMMQLHLAASAAEDIQINSIYLTTNGSGFRNDEIVNNDMRVYKDVNNNGSFDTGTDELIVTQNYTGANYNFPSNTTLSLTDRVIYAGSSENWIIINNFSGGDTGDNLELSIVANSDINTTGITSAGPVAVSGATVVGGRKTVVAGSTPGTLTLAVGGNDPGFQNIADGASGEVMFDLQLSANSEDIQVSEIRFAASGSGDESVDVDSVRLFEDVNNDGQVNALDYDRQIGNTLTSFTDDGDLVFSGISETIDNGDSENWLIVYDFNGVQTTNGETFQITLEGNNSVIDTGLTTNEAANTSGPPLSSGVATVSQTGSLNQGTNNPDAQSIAANASDFVMLQLNLSASATENIDVSGITFTMTGTGNENTDIDSIKLFHDVNGNAVFNEGVDSQIGSTLSSFTDNGTITFSSLTEVISSSSSENWIVVYYFNGSASVGETFRVYVANNEDLDATGAISLNTVIPVGAPVNGNTMTVSATGALTMALGSNNPGNANISGGASDVTMMQLNLSASATEDIEINSIYLTTSGSGIRIDEVVNPDIRIYRDVNNNGVYDSGTDQLIVTQAYTGANYNFPSNTTVTIGGEYIYAGTNENWLIINNFSGADTDDNIELSLVNNSDISATGVTSSNAVSITGATLNAGVKTVVSGATAGTLTMSVGANDPGYQNIPDGASDEVLFDIQLSTGSEAVDIYSITLSMSGSGDESVDVDSVRLFEDVNNDGQVNLLDYDRQIGSTLTSLSDNGSLVFSALSEQIATGSSENWLVVYDFNGAQTTNGETYQVAIAGNAAILDTGATSGLAITNSGAPIQSGIGTISSVGSLTLAAGGDNPSSQNIASSESNLELLQLRLTASATEAIDITAISFTLAGTADESSDVDSVRLFADINSNGIYNEGIDTQIGTTVTGLSDNGLATFGSLSEQIAAAGSELWLVVFDLAGTASTSETFRIYVANSSSVTATGNSSSQSINAAGTPVNGNIMTVSATGALTMALGSNNPGNANISGGASDVTMMQLNLSASATEDIEINSIYLTTSGSGIRIDEVVNPDIRIYRDVNNNGVYDSGTDQLIVTQAYTGANYNFPSNTTVTIGGEYIYAGTNENWLIINNFSGADTDDNIELSLVNNSDISATGVTSSNAVSITGATLNAGVKTVVSGATAGTLTMSVGANDPGYQNIPDGASDEVLFDIQLSTGSEAVDIYSITLSMSGSGDESVDVDSVRLFEDVNNDGQVNLLDYDRQIGSTLTSLSDNGSLVFSALSEQIATGSSENWLVVYDFNGAQTTNGETYQVAIAGNAAILDTGATSGLAITNSGAPIQSGIGTISSVGSLTLAAGGDNPSSQNIASSESNLELLQLRLTASATEAIDITAISFTLAGTADESSDVDSVRLFADINSNGVYNEGIDTQIGTTVTGLSDNGLATFGSLSEQIAAAGSELWLVVFDLAGTASTSETFRIYVANSSSVTATGNSSSQSINAAGTPVNGNIMTVSATGALTMALGSNNPGNANISGGASDVTMMQLNLSASATEDIEINSIYLTTSGSGIRIDEVVNPDIRIYRDVNNNGVYDSGTDQLIVTQAYTGANYNFPSNTTVTIGGEYIYAGTNENWLIINNFSGADTDDNIELSLVNNSDISATGVTSSNAVSITGATLNAGVKTVVSGATAGTLTMSVGANDPGYQNIPDGASDEVLFDIQLSTGSEAVDIYSITLSMSGSGDESVDVDSVRLFEDVNNDGQVNLLDYDRQIGSTLTSLSDNGSLVFSALSEQIATGSSENWLVVYDFNGAQTTNGETYQVAIAGNAAILDTGATSGLAITNSGAPIQSGIGTISSVGSLTLAAGGDNPSSQNIASSESNLELLQLRLTASATEAIDITAISFTLAGTADESSDVDSVRLFADINSNGIYNEGIDTQIGTTVTGLSDNGLATFGSLSEQIAAAGSELWLVVFDLAGTASTSETFRIYVANSSSVTATGNSSSQSINAAGTPVNGNIMTVSATGALTMALGSNNPGNANISGGASDVTMMQLNLSASATEDIEINSIYLTTSGSGIRIDEVVNPDIRIYRDVNNNGVYESGTDQLIVTQAYTGANYNFPSNTTVTIGGEYIYAGTSENWLIINNFSGADTDDNIELSLVNNSDISATGVTSSNAVSITGATLNAGVKTVVSGATAGTLTMSVGGNDPGYRNISSGANDETMFQLLLSAGSNEAIDISSVTFGTAGSGNESTDIDSVRLYQDVDGDGNLNLLMDTKIGATLTSFSDNGNLAFTSLTESINAGTSENWIVIYDLNAGQTTNGETFQVTLPSNGSVVDTGATSGLAITNSGAPLNSGLATISVTGNLALATGSNNPQASSISASDQEIAMLQLQLTANATEDIEITSISFNTSGTADESTDLDSAIVIYDVNNNGVYDLAFDTKIGATISSFTNDGLITISSINDTIDAGTSENWLVLYYLSGSASADETFRTSVNNSGNISATGISSTNTINPSGTPVSGNAKTVSTTGVLTMALAGNNPGNENINGNADDVTLMSFSLSANDVEDIDVTSITFTPTGSGFRNDEIEANDVNLYEDINGNGFYDSAFDRLIASGNFSGAAYNFPGSITLAISGEVVPQGSSVNWIAVSSFQNGDVNDNIEISIIANSNISGTGLTSSNPANIAGATLNGGVKTVVSGATPGTITLSAGAQNPAYRLIPTGTQNEVIIQLQLSASPVEDMDISYIEFVTSGSANESSDLDSARLFIDGDGNGNLNTLYDTQIGATITTFTDNDTLVFSGISETINSGASESWIIVYNLNEPANSDGETFNVRLSGNAALTVTGATSAQSILPSGAPVVGGTAVLTEIGTLTVSAGSNNPSNTNVTNSENNVVTIQLNIAAGSNEDVTVSAVTFTLSGTFDDATDFEGNSFVLYNDDNGNGALDGGETQLGTGQSPSGNNGTVTFSGLSETILASSNVNWILLVNLNGNASNFENFRVTFANSTNMTATGDDTGDNVYPDGTPVQGGLFTIDATGSLTLTTGANNPAAGTEAAGGQSIEMLQLSLTASGVEDIEITSITFTADGTGDDLIDLNDVNNGVSLYQDVNNNGQLDGPDQQIDTESTFSANNGTVTFTATDTIDAGTSENWLVVYDLDGSASNGETFRVGIYTSGNITATGITSTNAITPSGFPVVGNYKTIDAVGSLTLFTGANNPGAGIILEQFDFEMLQFRLATSSIEAIDIDDLTITHQGSASPAVDLLSNGVQLVRDVNGNGIYESGTDNILASTDFSGSTATFTLAPVTIPADSSENWLVMYDFNVSQTDGETFQARIVDLADIGLTGATSSQSITAGGSVPISGGTKTYDSDNPLPVELTSFTAQGDFGFVALNWVTQSEMNNLGFDLERRLSSETDFELVASYTDLDELKGQGTVSYDTEYFFKDITVIPEEEYTYRLIQYDYNGAVHIQKITASASAKMPLPIEYELVQNYPNPFNPSTRIKFNLPDLSEVSLAIYNILGQKVITLKDDVLDIGRYSVVWNGRNDLGNNVASGMYFYVLITKNLETKKQYRMFKKMLLVR